MSSSRPLDSRNSHGLRVAADRAPYREDVAKAFDAGAPDFLAELFDESTRRDRLFPVLAAAASCLRTRRPSYDQLIEWRDALNEAIDQYDHGSWIKQRESCSPEQAPPG